MHFEIYPQQVNALSAPAAGLRIATGAQWRWRLKADNGRIIANGGESFHNEADCLRSIELVKGTNAKTEVRKVAA